MADLQLLRWDAPGPYEVAFSTRIGGVSEAAYASLNLSLTQGDEPERVDENRRRLCEAVGADEQLLATGYQHHSTTVNRARPGVRGVPGDALWSGQSGLPMLALSADCVPIAVARANGGSPALAVLHAGWRGLRDGVVASTVASLGTGSLAAVVGPAIGPCCYEVGDEVAGPFTRRFGRDVVRGRKLDLWLSAERALRAAGVDLVERLDVCTACRDDLFFSHRRDGRLRGVQGVIGLVA